MVHPYEQLALEETYKALTEYVLSVTRQMESNIQGKIPPPSTERLQRNLFELVAKMRTFMEALPLPHKFYWVSSISFLHIVLFGFDKVRCDVFV